MKLKDTIIFIAGAFIIAFVYMTLSESFGPKSFFTGTLLGAISMFVCVLFFPKNFLSRYHVKWLPLLWYFACLVIIVIFSGIKSLILGFSKDAQPLLVTYKSSLESDMLITLLANSITLTPGTTTIDKNGSTLRVMKLCRAGSEKDLRDIEHLEAMIKKAQRSNS